MPPKSDPGTAVSEVEPPPVVWRWSAASSAGDTPAHRRDRRRIATAGTASSSQEASLIRHRRRHASTSTLDAEAAESSKSIYQGRLASCRVAQRAAPT